jgi:hypothetical protein
MVNHPPHYTRGPQVECPHCETVFTLEAIEVLRYVKDFRLATAMKYLWRVAFGGKVDDAEDVKKSVWYSNDFVKNPL